MAIMTPTKNKVCINCGELKTGEASCCGKGGDWANKCGNADDPRFYHSWSDGLLACESKLSTRVGWRSHILPIFVSIIIARLTHSYGLLQAEPLPQSTLAFVPNAAPTKSPESAAVVLPVVHGSTTAVK